MREALAETQPEYSTEDALVIAQKYGNAHKQPSGLMYLPVTRGTGTTLPQIGDRVTANYELRLLDGTLVDSSARRGGPISFRLGSGQVIAGWEEAFLHMHKGEKRILIVPYWLGYGVTGRPPSIPPRATLVFEVELVDFR